MSERWTDEDQQALNYQARQRRIAANRVARSIHQAGNAEYVFDLMQDWAPVILANRERAAMPEAPHDDPTREGVEHGTFPD